MENLFKLLNMAKEGHLEFFRDAFERHSIDRSDFNRSDGQTCALLEVVKHNDFPLVEFMLTHGADANRGGRRVTPMHICAEKGFVKLAKLLMSHGADVDAGTDYGRSPLLISVEHGQLAVAATLLESGAKVDGPILDAAVRRGDTELSILLIQHGADPMAKSVNWGLDAAGTAIGLRGDPVLADIVSSKNKRAKLCVEPLTSHVEVASRPMNDSRFR